MGKLFLDKCCNFTCLALIIMTVMVNAASERQYFFLSNNFTWVTARNLCQACYKDMVTVTPENTQLLAQQIMNKTSEHWIGLRKTFETISSNNESTLNFTDDDYDYDSTFNTTDNSTNDSTSSPTLIWTRWVNGDPLSFQNWHPGWPAPKFPLPKIDCCSCSCTCPVKQRYTQDPSTATTSTTTTSPSFSTVQNSASLSRTDSLTKSSSLTNATDQNVTNSSKFHETTAANDMGSYTDVTDMTSFSITNMSNVTNVTDSSSSTNSISQSVTKSTSPWQSSYTSQITTPNTRTHWRFHTELPIESTCERSPTPPPPVQAPYDNYIENSCVAMLTFGSWIEKHCEEELPFICYEDVFMGKVDVTNITFQNASLSWQRAPGASIDYLVEVSGDTNWVINTTNLTYYLLNLTAGTQYSIQVVSIKCGRALNPQNASFYTVPLKVENLAVNSVTETSVNLTWSHPVGNWSFYSITTGSLAYTSTRDSFQFGGLIAGTLYTFTILTGVGDKSQWSEESNVTAYTKPGKAFNLNVSDNADNSVLLHWNAPDGGFTGFIVVANDSLSSQRCNVPKNSSATYNQPFNNLQSGDEISLSVTAVANYTLLGDTVTTVSYTTPLRISNLMLHSNDSSISASWNYSKNISNSSSNFYTELRLVGSLTPEQVQNTTNKFIEFIGLQTAANYSVTVYAVSGNLRSPAVSDFKLTLPKPPTNARVISRTNISITFGWNPPDNVAANVMYNVSIYSGFWKYSKNGSVSNQLNYTFTTLNSGTNYNFSVFIVTPTHNSNPATCTGMTDSVNTVVSLSMMCSSSTVLNCDAEDTRANVLAQLKNHLRGWLGDDISWHLKQSTSPNT